MIDGQEMENDLYIKLLLEAKEDLSNPEGMTYHQFKQKLNRPGYNNIKQHPETLYKAIYSPMTVSETQAHHMGIDAYFQLLDYQELKLALENSIEAKRQARFAIWVTAIIGLVQVVLGIIQIAN